LGEHPTRLSNIRGWSWRPGCRQFKSGPRHHNVVWNKPTVTLRNKLNPPNTSLWHIYMGNRGVCLFSEQV